MDFRSVSKSASTRLAIPSTIMTPQLENYDLLSNFRDYQVCMSAEEEPFHLILNLACVEEEELALNLPEKNILQVQVAHKRKGMGGVPFARECFYKFILPNDVSKNPLTALWTQDDYLIVVESSNVADSAKEERGSEDETMDVEEEPEKPKTVDESENRMTTLQPRKVSFLFKPNLSSNVLRQYIEQAELGLFFAKRIVQNCSFVQYGAKEIYVKETAEEETADVKENATHTTKVQISTT